MSLSTTAGDSPDPTNAALGVPAGPDFTTTPGGEDEDLLQSSGFDSSDTLWPRQPATAAKHHLYEEYLKAWWPIMLQSQSRVTLVDAFAGPGVYKGGEPGSPVFALRLLLEHQLPLPLGRERVHLLLLEKRRDRYDHLRSELQQHFGDLGQLPVTVHIRLADAESDLVPLLTSVGAWGSPVLAIMDSYGSVRVPLDAIRSVAGNRASEVLVTFAPNWFSRNAWRYADLLDRVFGERAAWQHVPSAEGGPEGRWQGWLDAYSTALHAAGFARTLSFRVKPSTGLPLDLVFGTSHDRGLEVMKRAMWAVDDQGGREFLDPRLPSAQQRERWRGGLFTELDLAQEELDHLVLHRLASGPMSLDELRQWLLRHTARWRPGDAAKAVRRLRQSGQVRVAPDGTRITGTTQVRLT